ncbi:MAG: helix-turn-helix transcriptional regulator [Flavobacteriales bacterium]|jgi:transcriptional regulator with XRE-family HTH domain|nr:helix-turn-helix transcriptional regulator [Flavobacteriales bacterium]
MKNNIGLKIRQLRELRGFSQEYMANKLSISQRQYSKIERNETKIDWNKIVQISDILEITPLNLVSFDDTLIFKNNSTSEKPNYPKKLIEQYEKIIEQYERRLKQLEEENSFFKSIFIKNKKHK